MLFTCIITKHEHVTQNMNDSGNYMNLISFMKTKDSTNTICYQKSIPTLYVSHKVTDRVSVNELVMRLAFKCTEREETILLFICAFYK